MEVKARKCKGTGKAKGFESCGGMFKVRTYGLCPECYRKWLFTTPEGNEKIKASTIKAKKQIEHSKKKAVREEKKALDSKSAMKLADIYFSRYIRLKHSINGNCTCYTCGVIKPIKDVDNGHYVKRAHQATRYDENNCRPQCKKCNGDTLHNGKQVEFRQHLINEIGIEEVNRIETPKTIKTNALYYREIADKYREKVNELQKQLKVKIW